MSRIKTITNEIIGLFVDDGSFALATLAWVVIACIALRYISRPGAQGLILFLGLAIVLIESVLRFGRGRLPR